MHDLELTPKIRGGNPPSGPVRLSFKVRAPNGVILAEGRQDLLPAQGLKWQPLPARFQPIVDGQHSLVVEMTQPVSSVDVMVREVVK